MVTLMSNASYVLHPSPCHNHGSAVTISQVFASKWAKANLGVVLMVREYVFIHEGSVLT